MKTEELRIPESVIAEIARHVQGSVPQLLAGRCVVATFGSEGGGPPALGVAVFLPSHLEAVLEALAGPGGKITDVTEEWPTMRKSL